MKTLEELPIKIDHEKIAAFCRERGIQKMSLFGSVVRDDFDPARSDVDVLVEFLPDRIPGWEFFHWNEDLEPVFGRKVDLMTQVGRHLWPAVKQDITPIYEQA
jgi:predicted nucleotidyltransferase